MSRVARKEIVSENEVGVYHCSKYCVRRAYLFGRDDVTGKDFAHRQSWIRERMQFLAGVFAVDVLSYAILPNHFHVILRNRPDVAEGWSAKQVAYRWLRVTPTRVNSDGSPGQPTAAEIQQLASESEKLETQRVRLSSIGWFMRFLCEPIARRANKEDGCRGRFWESRYESQSLLDQAALLACSVYIDLNPIRSDMVSALPKITFTSASERLLRLQSQLPATASARRKRPIIAAGDSSPLPIDFWLSPVQLAKSKRGRNRSSLPRASDMGFMPFGLAEYVELLDWTAQQINREKPGLMPEHLAVLLEDAGISQPLWLEIVQNFGRWFGRAAGRVESLNSEAVRRGRRWICGVSHSRTAFE